MDGWMDGWMDRWMLRNRLAQLAMTCMLSKLTITQQLAR